MNHRKTLEFRQVRGRIEHHLQQVEVKLATCSPRHELDVHLECLDLLLEKAVALSGGTQETYAWGNQIAAFRAPVKSVPPLQLVRSYHG